MCARAWIITSLGNEGVLSGSPSVGSQLELICLKLKWDHNLRYHASIPVANDITDISIEANTISPVLRRI